MQIPDTILREMLGDPMADALFAARERLSDPTVLVRCEATRWFIERDAEVMQSDLDHDAAVEALGALEA